MNLVSVCTPFEFEQVRKALEVANIPFENRTALCDAGMEQVECYVSEVDFERAATLLELLDAQDSSEIDMSDLSFCIRCGSNAGAWVLHDSTDGKVEHVLCRCSEDLPVAFRDPVTKCGGMFDASTPEGRDGGSGQV
jgi:hypothetical protein